MKICSLFGFFLSKGLTFRKILLVRDVQQEAYLSHAFPHAQNLLTASDIYVGQASKDTWSNTVDILGSELKCGSGRVVDRTFWISIDGLWCLGVFRICRHFIGSPNVFLIVDVVIVYRLTSRCWLHIGVSRHKFELQWYKSSRLCILGPQRG